MKSPLLKQKHPTVPKEGVRLNRRVVVFLICLSVSAFFWIIQDISKKYDIQLSFPVEYTNIPKNKVIANQLPKTIEMVVNTEGYRYLWYKLFRIEKIISIDIKNIKPLSGKNQYFLLTNKSIADLNTQFTEDLLVKKVSPDTIFINFNKKVSKWVPVKTDIKIDYEDFYQATKPFNLSTDFIKISGAKEVVDKVNFIETQAVNLTKVKADVSLTLTIVETPDIKQLDLSPSAIKLNLKVDKYTEASLDLPIGFKNVPQGYSLKTFPEKVTVKFNIALNEYEKIKPSDFKAVVDFRDISKEDNKLKVDLVRYPKEINMPKISPEKVEFIVRK